MRHHVLLVVSICAISDAALIFLGTGGLGTLIQSRPSLLEFIRWFGVIYLTWFGIRSVRSAFKSQSLSAGEGSAMSTSKVVGICLSLTFLNPHVYLDTVILLGSIANQFEGDRWFFAIGGAFASLVWFSAIGFGARAASRYMSKPIFWKILDSVIAIVMFTIAITLAFYDF
jgi:L-lysine exporter family protein LysE/ArgO